MEYIAEIGSNHNQSKERIKDIIIQCKLLGFDAVKLQKFKAEKLWFDKEKQKAVKPQEMSDELFAYAVGVARKNNIKIGCSAFDVESLKFVAPHCDFLKISSFDVMRHDLIDEAYRHRKPVIISLGMATEADADSIYQRYEFTTLLHCISDYPAKLGDCRMNKLKDLKRRYSRAKIGWSDHTRDRIAILAAFVNGAKMVELHVDLDDKKGSEFKHGHCWTMSDCELLFDTITKYKEIIRYKDESKKDMSLMADPEDGLRPIKSLRK